MKKLLTNILCSTGITLILLGVIATLYGARFLLISSVFQSLGANIVIHGGLPFIHKFESEYAVLEYSIDLGYTILVALIFGSLFDWYSSMPVWTLVGLSILVYLTGIFLNLFHMRQDIEEINTLLNQRNSKSNSREINHDPNSQR